jgi:hypothetical protein
MLEIDYDLFGFHALCTGLSLSHLAEVKTVGILYIVESHKFYPLQLYFLAIKVYLQSKMQAECRVIKS